MRKDLIDDADPAAGLEFAAPRDVIDRIVRDTPGPASPPVRAPRRRRWALPPVGRRPLGSVCGVLALALLLLAVTQVDWRGSGGPGGPLEEAAAAMTEPHEAYHYAYDVIAYGTTAATRSRRTVKSRVNVWATGDGRYQRTDVVDRRLNAAARAAHGEFEDRHDVVIRRGSRLYSYSARAGGAAQLVVTDVGRCDVPPSLAQIDVRAVVAGAAVRNGRVRVLSQRTVGGDVVLRFRLLTDVPRGCRAPRHDPTLTATVVLAPRTFLPRSVTVRSGPLSRDDASGFHTEYRYVEAEHVALTPSVLRVFEPPSPEEACDPKAARRTWKGFAGPSDGC